MSKPTITTDEFDEAVRLVIRLWLHDGSVKDMGTIRKGYIAAGYAAALMIHQDAEPPEFDSNIVSATTEKALSGDALANLTCRIALAWAWRNGIEIPKRLKDFAIDAIVNDRPKLNKNAENPDNSARDKFVVWAIHCVLVRTKLKPTRNRYTVPAHSACDAVVQALREMNVGRALKYGAVERIWFKHRERLKK